jgi:hypothetical protein
MPITLLKAVWELMRVVFMRESFQVRKVRDATIVSSCAGSQSEDNASRVFAPAQAAITCVVTVFCVASLQPRAWIGCVVKESAISLMAMDD